jgi:Spy/CpxP family protein refolding chaperone
MRNPWKLTSFALAGALAVALVPAAGADAQPKMRDALDHLHSAERALTQASHDKGGHRKKALELTQAAITQVKAGIRFDNRN